MTFDPEAAAHLVRVTSFLSSLVALVQLRHLTEKSWTAP
jgi:hypothetical protein